MTTQDFQAAQSFRPAPYRDVDVDLGGLAVPYAGQTRMRLTITSGMADACVRIDPDATDLLAIAYGDDLSPRVRVSSSELRVSWPSTMWSWLCATLAGEDRDIEIVLHPAVEWTLQFRGGLSRFEADLTAGKLARLEISGGVSDVRFDLPAATGVVPIRISGGASELGLRRPADTGIALDVRGGIAGLSLDDHGIGAIGGHARLAAGLVHGDTPRYALEISGGASGLQIVPHGVGRAHPPLTPS
ncbi:MAG: hypothetical protein RLZZ450_2596 [Pseudomonadota bacterium]|jgi:hypothetical protein